MFVIPTMLCLLCLELCQVWLIGMMNWSERLCWFESESVEHDLVKVSMRGHVGVHGGLSH